MKDSTKNAICNLFSNMLRAALALVVLLAMSAIGIFAAESTFSAERTLAAEGTFPLEQRPRKCWQTATEVA